MSMDIYLGPEFNDIYQQYPLVLVDVGSRGGLSDTWNRAKEHLLVVGFEPDSRSFSQLTHAQLPYQTMHLQAGLYNRKTRLDFYLTRRPGDSSVLRPNREFLDKFPESKRYDIVETTQIEVDTLDNQLSQHNMEDVDFIKIDTQGSELSILQGGKNTLAKSVFGLEIEVEFSQMYEKQPLFSDVDRFVRDQGFSLYDLRPVYWKRESGQSLGGPKGQIIYADAVYFKDTSTFKSLLKRLDDGRLQKSKVLRALSVCAVYGYQDYALEILSETKEYFENSEFEHLTESVALEKSSDISIKFRGRARLSNMLAALSKMLDTHHYGWRQVGSNETLGNIE